MIKIQLRFKIKKNLTVTQFKTAGQKQRKSEAKSDMTCCLLDYFTSG